DRKFYEDVHGLQPTCFDGSQQAKVYRAAGAGDRLRSPAKNHNCVTRCARASSERGNKIAIASWGRAAAHRLLGHAERREVRERVRTAQTDRQEAAPL